MQSATGQLAEGWSLTALRSALRSGDAGAINRAAGEFYERCGTPVQNFCAKLLRQSKVPSTATDADDLALMAFMRVLEFLAADAQEKITDELHLVRILFRVARCLFIDTLRLPDTRNSRPQSDQDGDSSPPESVSTESTPEEAFVGPDKDAYIALQLLFHDGERWGKMMRDSKAGGRGFRQYRALALYEIAEKLREDLQETATANAAATRRLYRQLAVREAGMPTADWGKMEAAAMGNLNELPDSSGLLVSLRDAANAINKVDLQNRTKLYALRSEMGRFLAFYKTKWETIQGEL